jgi:hypothetical protein
VPGHLGRLTADEMHQISVDQLARRIFKQIKVRGRHNYSGVWSELIGQSLGLEAENKYDDAWFRLVDRNLIRWSEGTDSQRADYRLTERGKISRIDEGLIQDAEPSIGVVESTIRQSLDPVVKQYLREAIATFQDGRLLAAQFCLGAVAERVAFLLRDWIAGKTQANAKVLKAGSVSEVINRLIGALDELKKARADWEGPIADLLGCLESCAHVYRRSRNEIGHPTEVRDVNEDELAMMITAMQRRYLGCVYAVLALAV